MHNRRGARTRSSTGSTARAAATRRSTTGCATGWSRASATGAARSRSSTATSCGIVPVPERRAAGRAARRRGLRAARAARRWPRPRTGSTRRCPNCGGPARRETDTMDTFVDSSWYFLRYTRRQQRRRGLGPRDRRPLDARRPVHRRRRARDPAPAVRALLHQGAGRHGAARRRRSRSQRLFTQGMITRDGAKMSKSQGQRDRPQPIVERYGADTARCYILFIGPPDQDADWSDEGVEGVHRFLGACGAWAPRSPSDRPPARRSRPSRRGRRPRAAAQGALGDRQGHATTWRALRLQHRDRGGHGAGQRGLARAASARRRGARALRGRDRRLAALPVRAARGRRGLRAADRRARVGAAVAGGRRGAARARHSSSSCQVNGKVRDRVEAPAGARATSWRRCAAGAPNVRAHLDGHEVVKVVVVPGQARQLRRALSTAGVTWRAGGQTAACRRPRITGMFTKRSDPRGAGDGRSSSASPHQRMPRPSTSARGRRSSSSIAAPLEPLTRSACRYRPYRPPARRAAASGSRSPGARSTRRRAPA